MPPWPDGAGNTAALTAVGECKAPAERETSAAGFVRVAGEESQGDSVTTWSREPELIDGTNPAEEETAVPPLLPTWAGEGAEGGVAAGAALAEAEWGANEALPAAVAAATGIAGLPDGPEQDAEAAPFGDATKPTEPETARVGERDKIGDTATGEECQGDSSS